jgi:hypothetical protein
LNGPKWGRDSPRNGIPHPLGFIVKALSLHNRICPANEFCAVNNFDPAPKFCDRVLL